MLDADGHVLFKLRVAALGKKTWGSSTFLSKKKKLIITKILKLNKFLFHLDLYVHFFFLLSKLNLKKRSNTEASHKLDSEGCL